MGLFSNPCPNPDCSARVSKKHSFCSKCGYAGADSLVGCPECGKKAGGATQFCWNCGADLSKSPPPRIAGDRWVRENEEFAVRVVPGDCKGFLSRKVTVEPGTVGMLEKKGKVTSQIEWGTHTLEKLLQLSAPTSILLVSAGDVVLRPSFTRLHDANGLELDVTLQVVLRVRDYELFVQRFFEGHKRRVTVTMLEDRIAHELYDVTRGLVSGYTLEEMYGNLEWRDQLEQKLRDGMTVTLDRNGLELVQLNFANLGGDLFEQMQQDRGEVYMGNHAADQLGEKVAIDKRVRELKRDGKLDEYQDVKTLTDEIEEVNEQLFVKSQLRRTEREETVQQAVHELTLKNKLRAFEREDLEGERARQLEDEQLAREQELEKIQAQHQGEIRIAAVIARNKAVATEADFEREQKRLTNETELANEWQQGEQRRRNQRADAVQAYELLIKESSSNLEASKNRTAQQLEELKTKQAELDLLHEDDKKKQELKVEYERHQADLLRQMQQQEQENMASMQRFKLEEKKLELDVKRFETEKQTEVQLADIEAKTKIAESEAVKTAAVKDAVTDQLEQRLKDQQAATEALRGDADKRAGDLKEMAGIMAGSQNQTVVVPGQGVVQGAGAAQDQSPCPNCGRPVNLADDFCRKCGHDMRGGQG